jgi:hypothetical protein
MHNRGKIRLTLDSHLVYSVIKTEHAVKFNKEDVKMRRLTIYATTDKDVHNAIIRLMERKTGKKMHDNHIINDYPYVSEVSSGLAGGGTVLDRENEITLAELDTMPDYTSIKKMTVAEIAKALGHEVEIIK